MFEEKRPTCVTVIGWAWIVLGGLMAMSSAMVGLTVLSWNDELLAPPDAPFLLRSFPLLVAAQALVGVSGLFAGVQFLKLRAGARTALELLTWLLLVYLAVFGAWWLFSWTSMAAGRADGFGLMGALMGVFITAVYGIPVVIMLRYLRGAKVASAMR